MKTALHRQTGCQGRGRLATFALMRHRHDPRPALDPPATGGSIGSPAPPPLDGT